MKSKSQFVQSMSDMVCVYIFTVRAKRDVTKTEINSNNLPKCLLLGCIYMYIKTMTLIAYPQLYGIQLHYIARLLVLKFSSYISVQYGSACRNRAAVHVTVEQYLNLAWMTNCISLEIDVCSIHKFSIHCLKSR